MITVAMPMVQQRPRSLEPAELGFTPQHAVPWLNPFLLAGTAVRVLLAQLLGDYLDKRELQGALPADIHDASSGDELWFDYTADVGDGFNAAYTVAHTIAQPSIVPHGLADPAELPRGRLLVLGGDQAYPVASPKEYENRWKGPYLAALPTASDGGTTAMVLPGNHDWYDGLTSFLRIFARGDSIGGWRTEQTRSYFAVRLPHNWWLWAVDTQLDSYFDEPQLDYFEEAARKLEPDDRIVLCLARPAWAVADEEPTAFGNVDFFVQKIIEPTGARVPVMLAGDLHHYSRYEEAGTGDEQQQLVTCGGGGAYLSGTAHLPSEVSLPSATSLDLAESYPSPKTTGRLDWSVFWRLPWRNPAFVVMLGLFQTLLMLALLTADGQWGVDNWTINAPIGFAIVAVFAGTVPFATVMGARSTRHWIAGFVHAIPHVALGAVGAAVWSSLPFVDWPDPLAVLSAFVVYLPVIGLLDTWVLCAYLLVARRLNVNANELYAGIGIDDYKCFLRLHLGTDGTMTIYPIGIDRISRSWRADPDNSPDAPWIAPTTSIETHLIEQPITVR